MTSLFSNDITRRGRRFLAGGARVRAGLVVAAALVAGSSVVAAERRADEPASRDEHSKDRRGDGNGREGGRDEDRGNGDRGGDRKRGRSGGDGRPGAAGPYNYDFTWGNVRDKGYGDTRTPRAQEWTETQMFMRTYAPRRQSAIDQMQEGETKESVKRFMFARHRSLQSLQRRDPAGFERRLAQLRVEDQIFGIVSDWTGSDDAARRDQLKDTLRTQVGQLVDLELQERHRRVEGLRRELAEQSELLGREQTQRESLVEKRVSRFAEWAGRWASRRKENEAESKNGPDDDKRGAKVRGADETDKECD